MSDVSNRMLIDLIRFLETKGLNREDLLNPKNFPDLQPSDISAAHFFDSWRSIPWNTFADIFNSFATYFEDDLAIKEFMQWSFDSGARWLRVVMPVAQFFLRPVSLYKVVEWGSKVNFENMSIKVDIQSSRQVVCTVSLRPQDKPSVLWFRFGNVCLGMLPSLVGFRPGISTLICDGKNGEVHVTVAPAGGAMFRSFLLQPFRILFGAKSHFAMLNERDNELRHFHDEVVRTREAQDAVLAERTAQLAEAHIRMGTLMENVPDTIITLDRDKKITYINKIAPEFKYEEVVGVSCLDFVPDEIKTAYEKVLDEAILKGISGIIDLPVLGNTIWQTRVIPVIKRGVFQQLLLISTDMTEAKHTQQRVEEAREVAVSASRAKSAFLANMSHEIRTPLASIIGFSDLLSANSMGMTKTQASYCERILVNSRHLLNLVNDVLDIAKIEAGTVTLGREVFNVGDLIKEVVKMFSLQASSKNLLLEDVSENISDISLSGDISRLRQILVNLVGNAIKFTDQGKVQIKVEILPARNPHKVLLRISISDTGCGIDRDRSSFLFEPFEQENQSISKKYGGTGLGLFLSRNIARLMGGDVTLGDSVPGAGSTFVVSIEMESLTSHFVQEEALDFGPPVLPTNIGECKILVVEDNLDQAYLMQTRLEQAGYKAFFAYDGEAGVKLAVAEKPDLIIMDLQMPIMDGFSAARELNQLIPNIPIVALTAHANEKERELCMSLHFTEYWSKPIPFRKLLEGIDRVLVSKPAKQSVIHEGP